jgi:hypothetical protein
MQDPVARMTLTFYRRDGCSVCDEAQDLLDEELGLRAAAGRPIPTVEHVDIGDESDLEARYGSRIPVLAIGRHELDLVVTPSRLRALLDRAEADAQETASAWT